MIPDEKTTVDTSTKTEDHIQGLLHLLIKAPVNAKDLAPFKMAKHLYQSCMDTKVIEDHGLEPLVKIMNELGGWPVVKGDHWDTKHEWSWPSAVGQFRKLGLNVDYMLEFTVDTDERNSTSRIIYVSFEFH